MESCRRQIEKQKSAFICCVRVCLCAPFISFHFLVSARKMLQSGVTDSIVQIWLENPFRFIFQSSILLRSCCLFIHPFSLLALPFFFFVLEAAMCNSKNQNRINIDSFLPIYTFAPCYFFHCIPSSHLFYFRKNSLGCEVNHDAIDI